MKPKPLFRDRTEAAERLAEELGYYRGQQPLVLGIPRGGMVLAEILARRLQGDLDILLVRKLRGPGHPELAIGSITEQGRISLNPDLQWFATESYIEEEARQAFRLIEHRRASYTPGEAPMDPRGRVVIVVDDGIATGATMSAALRSLRDSGAKRVIAAAAVAPPSSVDELRQEADEVHCLSTPDPFDAVSLHFEDFREVSDEEVTDILRRNSQHPAKGVP